MTVAIDIAGEIIVYPSPPKSWKTGTETIYNFDKSSITELNTYGFYEVITPPVDPTVQTLDGTISFDAPNNLFIYGVRLLTPAEIQANKESELRQELLNEVANGVELMIEYRVKLRIEEELGTITQTQVEDERTIVRDVFKDLNIGELKDALIDLQALAPSVVTEIQVIRTWLETELINLTT